MGFGKLYKRGGWLYKRKRVMFFLIQEFLCAYVSQETQGRSPLLCICTG
jgi:hypothetical protein